MKHVWIVTEGEDYEGGRVWKVFDSEKKAFDFAKKRADKNKMTLVCSKEEGNKDFMWRDDGCCWIESCKWLVK